MKLTFGGWDWFSWHSWDFVTFPLPQFGLSLSLSFSLSRLGARRMDLGNVWVRRKPASCLWVL